MCLYKAPISIQRALVLKAKRFHASRVCLQGPWVETSPRGPLSRQDCPWFTFGDMLPWKPLTLLVFSETSIDHPSLHHWHTFCNLSPSSLRGSHISESALSSRMLHLTLSVLALLTPILLLLKVLSGSSLNPSSPHSLPMSAPPRSH